MQAQLGLAAAQASYARFFGNIWDDANPQFINHSFHYQLRHAQVTAKAKILADVNLYVSPWISGSLGVGFNNANEYSNTALVSERLPMTNFLSHSNTALTYTLGIGIQRQVINHWQIGFGFEFTDWGKHYLNRALGQSISNKGIASSHLYTNGLMFNMTYIA